MNCGDVKLRIDDLLDGRLSAAEAREVEGHLECCPHCAAEVVEAAGLAARIAGLPRALEPERDLWPRIAARLDEARVVRGRFGRRELAVAASILLAAAAVIGAYLAGRQQALTASALAPAAAPATGAIEAENLLASFGALGVLDYATTRRALLEVLEQRREQLAPETFELVMANLELIEESMTRIAAALGADPGNELLQRQLVAAYRRQVDLLERAARLPSTV
jgi:hypothetical protein